MNAQSALWILMTWCFSTRALVATVLTMHPCVSLCLRVNSPSTEKSLQDLVNYSEIFHLIRERYVEIWVFYTSHDFKKMHFNTNYTVFHDLCFIIHHKSHKNRTPVSSLNLSTWEYISCVLSPNWVGESNLCREYIGLGKDMRHGSWDGFRYHFCQ